MAMNKYDIDDDSAEFLESFMDNFNLKYPPRMVAGVKKYKTVIHKDYSIEEHIENLEQELFDALAYLHALRILVAELRASNEQLNEFVGDL